MNLVRYRADEMPPTTPEREAELRALAERPDSEIDFSDIPEADDIFFKVAITNEQYWAAQKKGPEALKALFAEQKAHRARLEAERDAKAALAGIDTEKPLAVHS